MKLKNAFIIILIFVFAAGNLCADVKGKISKVERINTAGAYTPRVLGLFIGIKEYDDPVWHNLKYPEKDVQDMVDFFTNNTTLTLDYKIVVTDPRDTTRDNILNHKLDEFAMENTSEEDLVIVYISSHGTLTKELMTVIEGGERTKESLKIPYILTSDTREGKVKNSALPLYEVTSWFEKLRSQRKVLILDMCHSGRSGKSQLSPDQAELLTAEKGISYMPMEDSRASIILSACPMGGVSFEDKNLKNSVYTHFLLEGMQKGDLNGDGAVSISEAHNYSIDKTRLYTWKRKKHKQVPTAYSKILGKDPIIVYGEVNNPGNPTLFSYASANQGVEVFIDDVHKGMLPKGIPVKPGEHTIECVYDGRRVYSEKIKLTSGADYMLPSFKTAEDTDKSCMILEGGYRSFVADNVSDDLIPDSSVIGFSVYRYGFKHNWLSVSSGMDFGTGNDLDQYALRAGVKYTKKISGTRLFAGPDFMMISLNYKSDIIDGKNVDKGMTLFCPGLETLLVYKSARRFEAALGARAYLLPYELNSKTEDVIATQFSLAAGFSF